jgi:hypothetical protein
MLRRLLAGGPRGTLTRDSGRYRRSEPSDSNPYWRAFVAQDGLAVRSKEAMTAPRKPCAGCHLWFDEADLYVSTKGKRACVRCVEHARRVLTPVPEREPVTPPDTRRSL